MFQRLTDEALPTFLGQDNEWYKMTFLMIHAVTTIAIDQGIVFVVELGGEIGIGGSKKVRGPRLCVVVVLVLVIAIVVAIVIARGLLLEIVQNALTVVFLTICLEKGGTITVIQPTMTQTASGNLPFIIFFFVFVDVVVLVLVVPAILFYKRFQNPSAQDPMRMCEARNKRRAWSARAERGCVSWTLDPYSLGGTLES